MPTRISGACNGCRTKKQKCSGDRSGCTQCHAAGIQCTWPEQRKRGPAKGYIEGLEHRLHEAESLLLALLPVVSSDQLRCATEALMQGPSTSINISGLKSRDSQSPGPHNLRSSPPVLNKKTGIEYWESFPLDTVENIRKWQDDCAVQSGGSANPQSQSSFRNSIDASHSSHTQILAALNHAASHSRPGSVDLSRHGHRHHHSHSHAQSGGPFRSMSSDSYRSGTSTPINGGGPQHSLSQSSLATASPSQQQHSSQQQQQQSSTPNWQSLSLFSPATNTSSPTAISSNPNNTNASNNNSSPNALNIGSEALLLQSFAESNWATHTSPMNGSLTGMSGVGSGMGGMGVESGPMEVDTGFFTNDMQRRLFW